MRAASNSSSSSPGRSKATLYDAAVGFCAFAPVDVASKWRVVKVFDKSCALARVGGLADVASEGDRRGRTFRQAWRERERCRLRRIR